MRQPKAYSVPAVTFITPLQLPPERESLAVVLSWLEIAISTGVESVGYAQVLSSLYAGVT